MCYSNVSSISNNNNNNNINNGKQIMSNNSNNNSNSNSNSSSSNNIKDNFKTPLTPLHRGGRERLYMGGLGRHYIGGRERPHKLRLEGLYNGIIDRVYKVCVLKNAFSLIELSIVLIIIGLLVAGVTGGKSLIESARSRALINELREYERAVWTFRAARDRFPGDRDNLGKFGYASGYTYSKTDFDEPYKSGTFVPDVVSAPFVELYTEGITDFKPLGNAFTADKKSTAKGVPNSKAIDTNDIRLYFIYTGTAGSIYSETPASNKKYYAGMKNFGSIEEALHYNYTNSSASKGMNPKILKQVDLKLDDGEHWNGMMRSSCYGKKSDGTTSDTTGGYTDYDYAIEHGNRCIDLFYAI